MKNNSVLSVIVLNYNAQEYLLKCLQSVDKSKLKDTVEFILMDNNSTDGSFETAAKYQFRNKKIIFKSKKLPKNIGFAAGNNRGVEMIAKSSEFVIFLNPDTTVQPDTFQTMINFFRSHKKVSAATCYVELALTGQLQPECHRGFPTPWNSFVHFFGFGLPKIFPKSKLFNGYFLGHLDYTKTQKIDCCVGAFFMLRKHVGQKVGWWNEKYFFYGEDLDFCYQLKKNNFSLYYYPKTKITHYQGVSSGIISGSKKVSKASRETKVRSAIASTQAMKIFYENNLINDYPKPLRGLVTIGINLLQNYRVFKARYL